MGSRQRMPLAGPSLLLLLLLVCTCWRRCLSMPRPAGDQEIITAEEAARYAETDSDSDADADAPPTALIELDGEATTEAEFANSADAAADADADADNESVALQLDAVAINDDLVFLAKRPAGQRSAGGQLIEFDQANHQSALEADGQHKSEDDLIVLDADGIGIATAPAAADPWMMNGIALQAAKDHIQPTAAPAAAAPTTITTITPPTMLNMSDFLALIPRAQVRAIVGTYYRRDPEVRRAYAYLRSDDFVELTRYLIGLPEVSAFLRYFNDSGLDVQLLVRGIASIGAHRRDADLMSPPAPHTHTAQPVAGGRDAVDNFEELNAIASAHARQQWPMATVTTTSSGGELNKGLHGLVDSVLEVVPQDEMLATFFDKLETDERFARLVDRIGSPSFAKILANMQNSLPLRNLVFTLHNNGVHVSRIVDSLKAYFFLGTF